MNDGATRRRPGERRWMRVRHAGRARSPKRCRPLKAANWIIAVLGLWEAGDVLAFLTPDFGIVSAAVVDHVIVGTILMLAGAGAALTRSVNAARTMDWIAAGAGAWLIVASFVLRSAQIGAGLWNDVIVGSVVLLLGVWTARRVRP